MLGKSIIVQIHIVKQIVEKSHEFDKDTHRLFVDFKAAYNSIMQQRTFSQSELVSDDREEIFLLSSFWCHLVIY